MKLSIRQVLSVMAVAAVIGIPAQAIAADNANVSLAAGYAFMYDKTVEENFPAGWFGEVAVGITDVWGVVGAVTGAYKTFSERVGTTTNDLKLKVHTFEVGPRVTGRSGQAMFYGQFLVGATRGSVSGSSTTSGTSITVNFPSETDFSFTPGVGVGVDLANNFGVQFGANFRFIRSSGETSKEFQLLAGGVYRFGK